MLPVIHSTSLWLYNIFLIPTLFFSVLFYLITISNLFLKPNKRNFLKNVNWPKVTIQIPTRNEPVALRCAKKCLELDYPKDKLEIMIGDDSNDGTTTDLIKKFVKRYPEVKLLRRSSNVGFKAGNLNNMLKDSNGEIIVVFDSDFIPPKGFLKKVVPPFLEDERVGCVQVKWKFLNLMQNRISKLASAILMVYHQIIAPLNSSGGVSLLFGSGEAVRKSLLLNMGGWQEGSLTEDVEFSVRILKNKYKTVYISDFEIPGEAPFTLKGFFKQQKKWAYGNVRTFIQHARWIIFGKLSLIQKFLVTFTLLGYASALFLVLFTVSGIVSFMSETPAPINLYKFFSNTGQIVLISSGFLVAMIVALTKEKKIGIILSVLGSSLTIGFVIAVGVAIGFINAVLGRKMDWSLIQKIGNKKPNLNLVKKY
jgi:cellulose synthase/poly-beta-1,6-N-acetylglucosamine synthase-like glycosyltransferase